MDIVVCIIILSMNKKILLGKRKKPPAEDGLYGFPGGKVEPNETLNEACRRELTEETSMTVMHDGQFLGAVDVDIPDVGRFQEIFFYIKDVAGTPINMEEDKCYGWEWFALDALPKEKTVGLAEFERQILPKLKKEIV